MSDLATLAKLARSRAQLPVNVYFDEALFQREMQQLFVRAARATSGHELMVPEAGDLPRSAAGRRRPRAGAQRAAASS